MERPRLTFDLDGVLCRPPFGINPGRGRKKRRDAPGHGGLLWLTERWRYLGRRPMPGSLEAFRALSARFECTVVTARGEAARPPTEAWFRRYLGEVPSLQMRPSPSETSAQFKVRVIAEIGPVAHFEDDPFTARWVAELIERVYVVDWCRNRWLEGPNIRRVRSAADAVEELLREWPT